MGYDDFPELAQALRDVGVEENWRTIKLLGRIECRDVVRAKEKMLATGHPVSETGYLIKVLEGLAEQNDREQGTSAQRYADWEA